VAVRFAPRHIAGLAEAIALSDIRAPARALHADASLYDDVEAIVHLSFLDDLLGVGISCQLLARRTSQNLAMRKFVEELQFCAAS